MNNRMSYNDVQQLKNHIRQRLQEASMQNGQMNGNANSTQRPQGVQRPPAGGRIAQANNRVAQQPIQQQPMQGQPVRPGAAPYGQAPQYQQGQQPVRLQHSQQGQVRPKLAKQQGKMQPQVANNATPQFEKQVAKKNVNQQGGTYFDKYDCGHKYPKMTVRQHLKDELRKDRNERIDNLRYAYVMSEILSEPVCKRRRKTQRTM